MDTRTCARCGKAFEPLREHARFCSARCRVAWNRENLSSGRRGIGSWAKDKQEDPETQASALEWAVIGMRDITERLGRLRPVDCAQAFAVIGEAVWWVTIVDATMVRYHPRAYEAALARLSAAARQQTEGSFGGLRFVRNWMGYHVDHADFIQPAPGGTGDAPVTAWRWKPLQEPALDSLTPRSRGWEMKRYHAYQRWLAGQTIGGTFSLAAGFLMRAADLTGGADAGEDAGDAEDARDAADAGAGDAGDAGDAGGRTAGAAEGLRPAPPR